MSTSGIESPVLVTMSPVSSPTQPETNATTHNCENLENKLILILPDLEEIASSEKVSIELDNLKEKETIIEIPLPQEESSSKITPTPTSTSTIPSTTASTNANNNTHAPVSVVTPPSPVTPTSSVSESNTENETKAKLIEEKVVIVVKDFKYCYEEFQKEIKNQNVTISMDAIMRMLRIAMLIVEQTNESGKNKKDFVIRMIAKIVTDCDDTSIITSNIKVEILNMLYSPVFDDTIKLIVDASKGNLDLNKVQEVAEKAAVGCFSRCLAFLGKKK
jgi:hypothetical protein